MRIHVYTRSYTRTSAHLVHRDTSIRPGGPKIHRVTSCYMIVYITVPVHTSRYMCLYVHASRYTYLQYWLHQCICPYSVIPVVTCSNKSGYMSLHARTPAHPHIEYIVIHPSDWVGPKYMVLHRVT